MPRVLIADRRSHYRETIRRVLERRPWTIAGEAESLPEAVRLAEEMKPDVVLLDAGLVLNVSTDHLRNLSRRFAAIRVIVMLDEDSPQYRRAVKERWGYECIAKEQPEEGLKAVLGATAS